MDRLKLWYRGLQSRERVLVNAAIGVTVAALVYLALFGPLTKQLNLRQQRVDQKQSDLAWMRGASNSVRMAAAQRGASNTGESLVVVVNRTAQQLGLSGALTNQTPSGDNSIRVRIENGQFDSLVEWLGALSTQHGIQTDSASIDRTDKPGIVNATVTLTRTAK